MKAIDILRELIAIELSKTRLGDDTHYFVESRDNIDGGLQQALMHLSKIVALNDDKILVSKWIKDIISHLVDVNKSALWKNWSYKKRKAKWNEIGNDLNSLYLGMKKKFESNRRNKELMRVKNQRQMPELSDQLKARIASNWDMLFDYFIDGNEEEFIYSLQK